jgi:hypothetical protein
MTVSKENYRLESRLVDIQNKLGEIAAKLDAHLKPEEAKAVKLPPKEKALEGPSSTPYTIKPQQNPESTITPPVVLPEGQTVPQAIEEGMQERQAADTIPAPKTPQGTLEPEKPGDPLKPAAPAQRAPAPKTPDEPMQ